MRNSHKITRICILLLILLLSGLVQYGQHRERQEEQQEMDIHRLIIGHWRVELTREVVREVVIHEDLTINDGPERGRLEILNPHNIIVIYRGREKGFEIRFESERHMMVRMHEQEIWVRCVRLR